MDKQEIMGLMERIDGETTFLCDCVDTIYIKNNLDQYINDDMQEILETYVNEHEIIYYDNAIKFLADNDPSLTDSIGYAHGMGMSLEKINSEMLATILFQELARNEIGGILK